MQWQIYGTRHNELDGIHAPATHLLHLAKVNIDRIAKNYHLALVIIIIARYHSQS